MSAIKDKFAPLAKQFDGFEEELVAQRNKERVEGAKQFVELEEKIAKLEQKIADESKKRIEVVKALRDWFSDQLSEIEPSIVPPLATELSRIDALIPPLHKRIDKFHDSLESKTCDIPSLIDHRAAELLLQLQEFKAVFAAAQKERSKKDEVMEHKIQEQQHEYKSLIHTERIDREKRDQLLAQEISKESISNSKAIELLQLFTKEELANLKLLIDNEIKDREEGDKDLTQAINHYTSALKNSLRVLSTGKIVCIN